MELLVSIAFCFISSVNLSMFLLDSSGKTLIWSSYSSLPNCLLTNYHRSRHSCNHSTRFEAVPTHNSLIPICYESDPLRATDREEEKEELGEKYGKRRKTDIIQREREREWGREMEIREGRYKMVEIFLILILDPAFIHPLAACHYKISPILTTIRVLPSFCYCLTY